MLRRSKRNINIPITVSLLLSLTVTCQIAAAQEYVGYLAVRYPNHMVKTFLQGPYGSKERCDSLNQTTWDNTLTACGTCKVDDKLCIPTGEMREFYSKALRKEKAAYPYVIATPKGRIIISGLPTKIANEECKLLAENFRSNRYSDARCVLP